jgi:hypothetical protein
MRRKRVRLAIGVAAAMIACASHSHATTFVLMSETELANQSVAAVIGSVADIEAMVDETTGGVNTYVRIDPDEIVFGTLPPGPIVLRERGGRTRQQSEWIFGSPEYRVGEYVLAFLSPNTDGTLRTTGMAMGKFSLKADARGVLTAERRLGEGAAVLDLQRGGYVSAGAPEDYDLAAMRSALQRDAAALTALARHAALQPIPPELARAPHAEHRESFTFMSPMSRWTEPDTGQAIPYLIDPTGDVGLGPTTSRAAIDDAFGAWTNIATSDVLLVDAGTLPQSVTFAGCSGGNRIMFNDPFNEITDPVSCSGILAIGGFCVSNETSVVNGTTFSRIRVGKITFNNGWSKCPGWNRCNLSEVATHELGHTLGFGHSTDTNATMYASAHFDGRCASLRSDDLAALNTVYPGGAAAAPSNTPTVTPVPPTATATPLPPSATPTVIRTATATATAVAATATATRTATAVPTATRTSTVPPTATRTPTPVAVTATASGTATATRVPSSTPTAGPTHGVRGRVRYYSADRAVPAAVVNLSGQMRNETQTTQTGDYGFDGVPSGTWEIAPQKQADFGLGVTPLDAAYVLQAVANLRQFDGTQRLACDVTGDGQLSALDATRILQFCVGTIQHLPVAASCGSDWTFIPDPAPMQEQSIVNPSISNGACNDGKIMLDALTDEAVDQDFRAILFGDCTGNWSPSTQGSEVWSARGTPRVRLGRTRVDASGRVQLPVFVHSPAAYNSLDLQLAYDPARLTATGVTVRRDAASAIATFHQLPDGTLRVAVASGDPITRRPRAVLTLTFVLASDDAGPGPITVTSAHIDEAPAKLR